MYIVGITTFENFFLTLVQLFSINHIIIYLFKAVYNLKQIEMTKCI